MKESKFASGSSDGSLILWQTESLLKIAVLKPFDELIQNDIMLKLNLTCITCIKPYGEVSWKKNFILFIFKSFK
jgi:hypothetical protein